LQHAEDTREHETQSFYGAGKEAGKCISSSEHSQVVAQENPKETGMNKVNICVEPFFVFYSLLILLENQAN